MCHPSTENAAVSSNPILKLYQYIKSLIEGMEVIPTAGILPSYVELKSSPDKFYDMFSEATHNYNVICDTLQKLQHANAMIVKILNDLMSVNCTERFDTKTQYTKNFNNLKFECAALISAYETAKASSESIVRYFNSAQYVICSRSFGDTHANY